jgi:predicted alpha/beta superfamily hydrolase
MLTLIPAAPIDPLGQRFSLKAAGSGVVYDITISEPKCPMVAGVPDPAAWLLYVVDGALHGGLATSIARVLSLWLPDAQNTQPVTVVSVAPRIGTAAEYAEYLQHAQLRDLVPRGDPAGGTSSAADAFLDFLHKEVDPAVRRRTPALDRKALLVGHGLSGLVACHAFAKQHPMFDRYIIASPTLLDDSPTRQKILQASRGELSGALYLAISSEDRLDAQNSRHEGAIGRGFHDLASLMGRLHRPRLRCRTDILTAESFESIAGAALINGLRWHLPSTGRDGRRMILRHPRGYLGMLVGMLKMFRQAKREQKTRKAQA